MPRVLIVDDDISIRTHLASYVRDLDHEVEASVAAYRDPWMERESPAFPGQFEDARSIALPMLG